MITRFIPAYAGNTLSHQKARSHAAVHPRICGEHSIERAREMIDSGSSPHMRGTLTISSMKVAVIRFIPAYAGNTARRCTGAGRIPVHPRICGEHSSWLVPTSPRIGSSPHMRGTRQAIRHPLDVFRFIPAYAGNTRSCRRPAAPTAVHPRICGEHRGQGFGTQFQAGSSPHMRGTLRDLGWRLALYRFIPAYAGNTATTMSSVEKSAVHPRICGEHESMGRTV